MSFEWQSAMGGQQIRQAFAVAVVASTICGGDKALAGAPFGIERVSLSSKGQQGIGASSGGSMSADGRYVAFTSNASNLVSEDTNGEFDVFVRDRLLGSTERVSIGSDGSQANGFSSSASLSANGQYVAFVSAATNLAPFDLNEKQDVFVHDRSSHTTIRVSVGSTGQQADGDSDESAISANGRFVAFRSFATNFAEDDINNTSDIFVHDVLTGITELVNVDNEGVRFDGAGMPSISGDGRFVAFSTVESSTLSAQIVVRDRLQGRTAHISIDSSGRSGNQASYSPSISSDGRLLAFYSYADNLVSGDTGGLPDIFWADTGRAMLERITQLITGNETNGSSSLSTINADGKLVAFLSDASNIVPNDINEAADVFVYDTALHISTLVTVSGTGEQANDRSYAPFLSGDGSAVGFMSRATNLVPGDSNGDWDVFVVSLRAPTATPTPTASATARVIFTETPGLVCAGDCNKNAAVTVDELVRGVNMLLGNASGLIDCPAFDLDRNDRVTVDELVAAVNRALNGCV